MTIQNRVLGKGKLRFGKFKSGTTVSEGLRYFGNSTEFSLSVESETLDHFDSDNGIRQKDDSVTVETNRTANLVVDNISAENMALFFQGSVSDTVGTGTPVVGEALTIMLDRTYQLGKTPAMPTGVRDVSNVVVEGSGGTPTYVEGVDYTVDVALGFITFINGGTITDNSQVEIDYTPGATTRETIISSSETIEGELHFESTNPKGKHRDAYMAKVLLSPSGEFALKGDEWQQIGFSVEIQQLNDATAAIYLDGRAS